jgi:hypothetical protein
MRKRLAQVLEKDDEDEPMDAVVRRFWSRTERPTQPSGPALVVDLALARRARAQAPSPRF